MECHPSSTILKSKKSLKPVIFFQSLRQTHLPAKSDLNWCETIYRLYLFQLVWFVTDFFTEISMYLLTRCFPQTLLKVFTYNTVDSQSDLSKLWKIPNSEIYLLPRVWDKRIYTCHTIINIKLVPVAVKRGKP